MEFWTKLNKYASWIQDVALKGKFSSAFLKIQSEIKKSSVLLVAIAVDSFCSSFCHQEKPKQPSYISFEF